MRLTPTRTALCALLLAPPAAAQEWTEYENRLDRFTIPAPGQPKVETMTWDSEYGARFPGRVYRWEQGRNRYSVTVVDYSDAERIHAELNHAAYRGGPYWQIDIMASIDYAATRYRQKRGVTVTYDAWHYIERVTGHELQLTNPGGSRSYVGIYLHENRLYVLDATAPADAAPPISFQQSFGFLDATGKPVQYRSFYFNRLPPTRLDGGGGPSQYDSQGPPPQQAQPAR
ncbi:MAG: hypothetical protein A3I61_12840 [Acidobacteria bacterium RIFCSPLOWO2_02_FULL_68_18]|nr:MAG: hypothetical protein A3I61_12840 [Acidobacteria bacterium RIFCSPLOWO2_02_FULL_68_18]OFW47949.1 MAG: hypothetical protein A3G77_07070 [Acidobacteria bacterium RIFCSPLOWO2_12_FULL_68_19]